MSTEIEIDATIKSESLVDQVKSVLQSLLDQAAQTKVQINTARTALKEAERQSKELEKLRNKRNRTKVERAAGASPSGITKPVPISDELATFLNVPIGTLVPRNEVTKGVSGFVKENSLSDPDNKQKFVLDDRPAAQKLRALLGNPSEAVTYFNLQRYLKHHYIMSDAPPSTPKKSKAVIVLETTPAPVQVVAEPVKVKKTIMVKKKKEPLAEEA
jgi:chromatin remodeling complex protein RSC6